MCKLVLVVYANLKAFVLHHAPPLIRFPSVPFTTKNGLNRILGEAKLNKTNYPRCYEVGEHQILQ